MVKAHEGMHERRQSQADWCAGAGYEITNSAEAESRDDGLILLNHSQNRKRENTLYG